MLYVKDQHGETIVIVRRGTFNTHRMYSKDGQVIHWAILLDGTILFEDVSRHISGALTHNASVFDAEATEWSDACKFVVSGVMEIESTILANYDHGLYTYDSHADLITN